MSRRTSLILKGNGSVAEHTLAAEPFLGGYRKSFDAAELYEITDLSIVSIACPLGDSDRLNENAEAAWGHPMPAPGASIGALPDNPLVLGMSPDQWFALFQGHDEPALELTRSALGAHGYLTDQSDNWVALRLAGALAIPALERICPIDLHPRVFTAGTAARTVMEHLGSIIYCEEPNRYLLLSASSSAESFLHAVTTSIGNVS